MSYQFIKQTTIIFICYLLGVVLHRLYAMSPMAGNMPAWIMFCLASIILGYFLATKLDETF